MTDLIIGLLLVLVTGIAVHGYFTSQTIDALLKTNALLLEADKSQRATIQSLLEAQGYNMNRIERLERKVFQ